MTTPRQPPAGPSAAPAAPAARSPEADPPTARDVAGFILANALAKQIDPAWLADNATLTLVEQTISQYGDERARAAESRGAKARDAEWREAVLAAYRCTISNRCSMVRFDWGTCARCAPLRALIAGNAPKAPTDPASGSPSVPAAQPTDQASQRAAAQAVEHRGEICGGSMTVAVDLQGETWSTSTPVDGECGFCHGRIRIDNTGRVVVHPAQRRAAPTPALPREAPEPGRCAGCDEEADECTCVGRPRAAPSDSAPATPGLPSAGSPCEVCGRPPAPLNGITMPAPAAYCWRGQGSALGDGECFQIGYERRGQEIEQLKRDCIKVVTHALASGEPRVAPSSFNKEVSSDPKLTDPVVAPSSPESPAVAADAGHQKDQQAGDTPAPPNRGDT